MSKLTVVEKITLPFRAIIALSLLFTFGWLLLLSYMTYPNGEHRHIIDLWNYVLHGKTYDHHD